MGQWTYPSPIFSSRSKTSSGSLIRLSSLSLSNFFCPPESMVCVQPQITMTLTIVLLPLAKPDLHFDLWPIQQNIWPGLPRPEAWIVFAGLWIALLGDPRERYIIEQIIIMILIACSPLSNLPPSPFLHPYRRAGMADCYVVCAKGGKGTNQQVCLL